MQHSKIELDDKCIDSLLYALKIAVELGSADISRLSPIILAVYSARPDLLRARKLLRLLNRKSGE